MNEYDKKGGDNIHRIEVKREVGTRIKDSIRTLTMTYT